MSATFKQVIEDIAGLSSDEKALVAHCLIASLESKHDDGVDEAWKDLAEKRYLELKSVAEKGVSWQKIKNEIKGQNA